MKAAGRSSAARMRMEVHLVPWVPPGWSRILTWLTLLWAALIVGFSYLRARDIRGWLVSLMVFFST